MKISRLSLLAPVVVATMLSGSARAASITSDAFSAAGGDVFPSTSPVETAFSATAPADVDHVVIHAVPEPMSLVLLGSGLAAVGVLVRGRRPRR